MTKLSVVAKNSALEATDRRSARHDRFLRVDIVNRSEHSFALKDFRNVVDDLQCILYLITGNFKDGFVSTGNKRV